MEDKFELKMLPMGRGNTLTIQVKVYYRSEVVIRFRLTGGSKILELEKRLMQKQNSWKLLSANFTFDNVNEFTTRNLFEIFHMLDEEITGNSRITYRHPLERRSNK